MTDRSTVSRSFRRRAMGMLLPAVLGAATTAAVLQAQTPPAVTPPAAPTTAPATAPAKPGPDTVVFTFGGDKVTLGEYEQFVGMLPPDSQAMARQPGPARRAWAESFVNMKLLAKEAAKRELDKRPDVQRTLAAAKDQVMANALVTEVQEKIDDATLKAHFEKNRATLERVSARHILIRFTGSRVPIRPGQKDLPDAEAKAKAEQLVARLKAGEDFAKVAQAESDDVGSAVDGGDLGSFTRGRMVAPFEQAAFVQKENEIGVPVRSDFGWHIIQVTGKFDSFEKLADTLKEQLGPQQTNLLIKTLRGQTPPVFNDAVLGPALPSDMMRGEEPAPAPTTAPATAPATAPQPK